MTVSEVLLAAVRVGATVRYPLGSIFAFGYRVFGRSSTGGQTTSQRRILRGYVREVRTIYKSVAPAGCQAVSRMNLGVPRQSPPTSCGSNTGSRSTRRSFPTIHPPGSGAICVTIGGGVGCMTAVTYKKFPTGGSQLTSPVAGHA